MKKIGELYLTYQPDDLQKICEKVKETEESANIKRFYGFMLSGLWNYRIMNFVQYNAKEELVACGVLGVVETPMGNESVLYIHFAWIDAHYPDYWKTGLKFIEDVAKNLKIRKIMASTTRLPEAFIRKFKFKKSYCVLEKEVV